MNKQYHVVGVGVLYHITEDKSKDTVCIVRTFKMAKRICGFLNGELIEVN